MGNLINKWEVENAATSVIEILKDRTQPDNRFRNNTIKGQLQEVYFTYKNKGIKMNKKHLVAHWETHLRKESEYNLLRKRLHELLNIKRHTERKIEQTLKALDNYE